MSELTSQQLEDDLLRNTDCPWSTLMRNKQNKRALSVHALREFAQGRGYDADAVESAMDAYVRERSGKRQRISDPWAVIPNLFRRAKGEELKHDEVWLVPDPKESR